MKMNRLNSSINKNTKFTYLKQGIEAQGHSPIYKMHKYFARRPYNVFHHIIEAYTNKGDIILDPFCGGGVTLIEGLSLERKVIATDVNPLATFITECETTYVPVNIYDEVTNQIFEKYKSLIKQHYITKCRSCLKIADVRWLELAYKVVCKNCQNTTLLSNERKSRNGFYKCINCQSEIAAVDSKRTGYEIVNVVYRCTCQSGRQSSKPTEFDIRTMMNFEDKFDELINTYKVWYPTDKIPEFWERQQEDCLYRKSIFSFSDLFTKRSLFFNSYLLKLMHDFKLKTDKETYKMLIFTFSAIIRYTNSMTYSAENWMGGRPIAWDKHAYWMPNQFVEVNPLEYFEKRKKAIIAGLKSQEKIMKKAKLVSRFDDLNKSNGTHIVWNMTSSALPLSNESIDAVITDPPYGSNVQYGELCHYWLVWLQKDLDLKGKIFNLEDEILVNRKKTTKNYKDYHKYYLDLLSVYSESFRVLKEGGVLVFTFNNKDLRAWYSVVKAAIKAGFHLEPEGVIYQEPIENYRNTAHNRFDGTIHGDFIYTFRKITKHEQSSELEQLTKEEIISEIKKIISIKTIDQDGSKTATDRYLRLIPMLIPYLVVLAKNDGDSNSFINLLSKLGLSTSK